MVLPVPAIPNCIQVIHTKFKIKAPLNSWVSPSGLRMKFFLKKNYSRALPVLIVPRGIQVIHS
jgi:hypothetical protein